MPKLKFFNLLEQRNSQGLKMNFLVMQWAAWQEKNYGARVWEVKWQLYIQIFNFPGACVSFMNASWCKDYVICFLKLTTSANWSWRNQQVFQLKTRFQHRKGYKIICAELGTTKGCRPYRPSTQRFAFWSNWCPNKTYSMKSSISLWAK
jgi:hypothetical protein